ncbi:MAG TPA: hypothetical protein PLR76_14860 [Hyphomonas sp.]|nr:hypothetical protein [Hyphomonas sp.]
MMKRFAGSGLLLLALCFAPAALAAGQDGPSTPIAAPAQQLTDIDVALDTFLSSEGDKLILLPNRLDKSKLDFSMDSLHEIDSWLQAIYTLNRLDAGEGKAGEFLTQDGRGDNSIMFAGLYMGEVVRLNAKQTWVWQPFETFVAKNPGHAQALKGEAGFDKYVLVSPQGVATPMNSALKRVLNGPIDSVHYVATFLSEPVDLKKAVSGRDFSPLTDDPSLPSN